MKKVFSILAFIFILGYSFSQTTGNALLNSTGQVPIVNGGTASSIATGSGAVVLSTSPTLVTPTISSTGFTNAQHAHTGATSGGQITTAALSDYVGPTNYTSSSTITGFTSNAACTVYYTAIGNLVYIEFSMSGTSNTTLITFTVPYAMQSYSGLSLPCARTKDNGGAFQVNPGGFSISSTTVTLTYSMAGTAYTASGAKVSYGSFWYFK